MSSIHDKSETIYINNFINNLNNLCKEDNNKEDNKDNFINNYNKYRQQINFIDEILNEPVNLIDDKSISELFSLLQKYECIFKSNDDIDINTLKNIINLTENIDIKLKQEQLEINEIIEK